MMGRIEGAHVKVKQVYEMLTVLTVLVISLI